MQWASSTTSMPTDRASCGSTSSRKPGALRRSGLIRSRSSLSTSAWISSHCVMFAELIVAARMPARAAASTWLRMSASSGETIIDGPSPASRNSFAAIKYTADFPQPVRCTTSMRLRWLTRESTAVHWSSRRAAWGPAMPLRSSSACSRVAVMAHTIYHGPDTGVRTVVPSATCPTKNPKNRCRRPWTSSTRATAQKWNLTGFMRNGKNSCDDLQSPS